MEKKDSYCTKDGNRYSTNLSVILDYINRGFVILSAYQNRDEETERKALDELAWAIHHLKASFKELDGVWTDEKTSEEIREMALFVPYPGEEWGKLEDFINKMLELAKQNNQDGIIRGDEKKIELLYLDGNTLDLGEFHIDKLSSAYSKISKGRHTGRTFAFRGVRVPRGVFDALVMKKRGYIVEGTIYFVIR